jgi:hypothetical protein
MIRLQAGCCAIGKSGKVLPYLFVLRFDDQMNRKNPLDFSFYEFENSLKT